MQALNKLKKQSLAVFFILVLSFSSFPTFAASTVMIDDAAGIEPQNWSGTAGYNYEWNGPYSANDYSLVWSRRITGYLAKTFTKTQSYNFTGKTKLNAYVTERHQGTLPSAVKASLIITTSSATRYTKAVDIVAGTPYTALTLNLTGLSGLDSVQSISIKYITPSGTDGYFNFYADCITVE